jgi:hypothetical protein
MGYICECVILHKYFPEIQTLKNSDLAIPAVLIEMYFTKSMALYGLDYADLNITPVGNVPKFIKPKGLKPTN